MWLVLSVGIARSPLMAAFSEANVYYEIIQRTGSAGIVSERLAARVSHLHDDGPSLSPSFIC